MSPGAKISAKHQLKVSYKIILCSFNALVYLLPATAVIVSEEGDVTMSDADTTVNPKSTLTVPTSTTSVTPTQRNDSDLGISILISSVYHYIMCQ